MSYRKTCVVTGGAGFIGSHLCTSLLAKDYSLYCLDNLLTGSVDNLSIIKKNPNFHFIKTDIIKDPAVYFNNIAVDYIYHLASPASPPKYLTYSIETHLVNSLGTYNMLKLAKSKKSRFLLASTSEIYGDPKEHPQRETYFGNVNPVGIRSCYDESKRFAESLTMEFFRKFDLQARIIRIFNTYGPNMQIDDGRVISNFITEALSKRAITIYGRGEQTRSFCYVSDLVKGLILAMENNNASGKIINLGNPEELTIRDLAEKVLKLSGSNSKIINLDIRLEDDPEKRKPDINFAKKLLNFTPVVKLDDGLKKTIAYFNSLKLN